MFRNFEGSMSTQVPPGYAIACVTLYDETMGAVRLRPPSDGTRSYGIIATKQQPQEN